MLNSKVSRGYATEDAGASFGYTMVYTKLDTLVLKQLTVEQLHKYMLALKKHLVDSAYSNLKADGASVNMGHLNGLGSIIKELAP